MQIKANNQYFKCVLIIVAILFLPKVLAHSQSFAEWDDELRALFQVHAVRVVVNLSKEVNFEIGDEGLFRSLIEIPLRESGLIVYQHDDYSDMPLKQLNNLVKVYLNLDVINLRYEEGGSTGWLVYVLDLEVWDHFRVFRYEQLDSVNEDFSNVTTLKNIPMVDAAIWSNTRFGYCRISNAKAIIKEAIAEMVTVLRNDLETANSDESMEMYRQYVRWYDSVMSSFKK